MNPIRVLSIESDEKSEQALRSHLARMSGLVLAGEASTAPTALQLLSSNQVDVVLLDLGLHDMDGIGLIKQIRQLHPSVRVLIVTASDSPEDIFASMDAGADAYVLKSSLAAVLEVAVYSAKLGTVWLDPAIARQVLDAIEAASSSNKEQARILPTGYMPMPLKPQERSILSEVAASDCCKDGVCMVDPSFIRKLKRFHAASA